jgi:catechol 2,3-dioxygenase-like lactoylglutathione lyase family enzyme
VSNKPEFGFVVEYVTDVEAARRFYVDVLGLEVERYSPEFVQFNHFAIAGDEPLSGKRAPELYWLVDDAEEAFRDLSQKAEVVLPLKQMPFGKVFGIKDPTGQPFFVLEFAEDRPSRPVK